MDIVKTAYRKYKTDWAVNNEEDFSAIMDAILEWKSVNEENVENGYEMDDTPLVQSADLARWHSCQEFIYDEFLDGEYMKRLLTSEEYEEYKEYIEAMDEKRVNAIRVHFTKDIDMIAYKDEDGAIVVELEKDGAFLQDIAHIAKSQDSTEAGVNIKLWEDECDENYTQESTILVYSEDNSEEDDGD